MRHFHKTLAFSLLFMSFGTALTITSTDYWNITVDPQGSVTLNGLSFQQSPLTTFGEYQYVTFYSTATGYGKQYVNVGRRPIFPSIGVWESFALTDYIQQTLDEHNTISMGISSDGKIHLSFDHHDVPLNYRVSNTGIAKDIPSTWDQSTFGSVQHTLPGSTGPWTPLTYPRFQRLNNTSGDLLMEFRIGVSGAGDSWIHIYNSAAGQWSPVGKYLIGEDNNAYINGLSERNGKLYVSYTVRETPDAMTNHDFYFTYYTYNTQTQFSDGTWRKNNGDAVAAPIAPSTPGIKIYAIPQNSQIINQEAQCIDDKGRFHALMRDNTTGVALFYHYLRSQDGQFIKTRINAPTLSTPPYLSYRGKIVAWRDNLIAILPDQPKAIITAWASTAKYGFTDWTQLATIPNMACEPLVDEERLNNYGVLSLFLRQGGPFPSRMVQVWDFELAA